MLLLITSPNNKYTPRVKLGDRNKDLAVQFNKLNAKRPRSVYGEKKRPEVFLFVIYSELLSYIVAVIVDRNL